MLSVQDWGLPFSKPLNLCTKEVLLLVYVCVQVSLPECVHLEEYVHKCVQVSLPMCASGGVCTQSVHVLEDTSACLIDCSFIPFPFSAWSLPDGGAHTHD